MPFIIREMLHNMLKHVKDTICLGGDHLVEIEPMPFVYFRIKINSVWYFSTMPQLWICAICTQVSACMVVSIAADSTVLSSVQ